MITISQSTLQTVCDIAKMGGPLNPFHTRFWNLQTLYRVHPVPVENGLTAINLYKQS